MSTIDLGNIKFNWKGTKDTSTAYAIDDVVYVDPHSYVCVQAHTNQAVNTNGNNAYWEIIASGANLPGQTGNAGKALKTDGSSLSWDTAGGILQMKKTHWTNSGTSTQSSSYVNLPLTVTITPTNATSSFYIHAWVNMHPMNHDSNAVLNIHDSALGSSYNTTSQHCFQYSPSQDPGALKNLGYMNFWSTGSQGNIDDYRSAMTYVGGLYAPASDSSSARTFTLVVRNHLSTSSNGFYYNYGRQNHAHQSVGTSHMIVQEIADGIIT